MYIMCMHNAGTQIKLHAVIYMEICSLMCGLYCTCVHINLHSVTCKKTDTERKDETNPSTVNLLYNPGHTPDCESASTTETHNSRGYV